MTERRLIAVFEYSNRDNVALLISMASWMNACVYFQTEPPTVRVPVFRFVDQKPVLNSVLTNRDGSHDYLL